MQILAIYLSSSRGFLIDTTRGAHIVKQNYDGQQHLSTFLYAIFLNIIAMFSSKESIFDPTRHSPCHWIILARAQEIHSILHQCILYTFFHFLRHLYCISIKWWTFYLLNNMVLFITTYHYYLNNNVEKYNILIL